MVTAQQIIDAYKARGLMIATAESCTGGMIAVALTDIAGSSAVFERGFVTYANDAKTGMLGVTPQLIDGHGAVSPEVAAAMAEGGLMASRADWCLSVTGVAGPDGGSADKPVGLVWFGLCGRGQSAKTYRHVFTGNRAAIRHAAMQQGLNYLLDALG